MIFNITWRVFSTDCCSARIYTLIIATCQTLRTATITQANWYSRCAVFQTYTDRSVIYNCTSFIRWTNGVFPQGRINTRIFTLSSEARHNCFTIIICATLFLLNGASQFSILIDHKTKFTNANRIVSINDTLFGVFAIESWTRIRTSSLRGAS